MFSIYMVYTSTFVRSGWILIQYTSKPEQHFESVVFLGIRTRRHGDGPGDRDRDVRVMSSSPSQAGCQPEPECHVAQCIAAVTRFNLKLATSCQCAVTSLALSLSL